MIPRRLRHNISGIGYCHEPQKNRLILLKIVVSDISLGFIVYKTFFQVFFFLMTLFAQLEIDVLGLSY